MTKRISARNAQLLRQLVYDNQLLENLWLENRRAGTIGPFVDYWTAVALLNGIHGEQGKRTFLWSEVRNRAIQKRGD